MSSRALRPLRSGGRPALGPLPRIGLAAIRSGGRGALARAVRFARAEPAVLALAAVASLAYATFSVLNHGHFGTYAYDLGIFDQVMWHYSRFELPETTIVGLPTALGDHLHPVLLLLTPLYWIWADPRMLLGAQAVLLGASVVPVFVFCRDHVGRGAAYALAAAYLLFWGVHSAVAFDFHEIAFAPIVLAGLILAVERRRWGWVVVLALALLLIKENLALLVVFIGLYVVLSGRGGPARVPRLGRRSRPAPRGAAGPWADDVRDRRRTGLVLVVGGVVWYFAATRWLIPYFGDAPFRHFRYQQFGTDLPSALASMVRDPWHVVEVFFTPVVKVQTLALLFLPFLGLIFLSPLAILLVPLLGERMLGTNTFLWGTSAHYSLVIAPVLVMGAAVGLARLLAWWRLTRRLPGVARRPAAWATGLATAMLVANAGISSQFPPMSALSDPAFYRESKNDRLIKQALALIPPDAPVAAQTNFVAHLSQRRDIYQLGPGRPTTDYVVANGGDMFRARYPSLGYVDRRRLIRDRGDCYAPIFYAEGYVVLRRIPGAMTRSKRFEAEPAVARPVAVRCDHA